MMGLILLSIVAIGSAIAAVSLRRLVHCALSLTVTFAALAGIYLNLGAQFVGFAQVLVYIGAVSILVLFAILLTGDEESPRSGWGGSNVWVGIGASVGVFALIAGAVLSSRGLSREGVGTPEAPVRNIGDSLMTDHILSLEIMGVLLTAALIGAVILAMNDRQKQGGDAR